MNFSPLVGFQHRPPDAFLEDFQNFHLRLRRVDKVDTLRHRTLEAAHLLSAGSFHRLCDEPLPRLEPRYRILRPQARRWAQYDAVVPSCCRSGRCEEMFKPRTARRNLKRYRQKGLDTIERRMVASVPADDIDGARVLEIGGGIGTLQARLLAAGASRGEIVELVAAYQPYARQLAHDEGFESRSTFRVADVLEQPDAVAPATIVVLNRVVCCSPEGVSLTGVAARLAERILLLSFPRDRWLVRVVARVINGTQRLMGRSFRVFVHPQVSLYAAAQAEGFRLVDTGRSIAWEFAALRRAR